MRVRLPLVLCPPLLAGCLSAQAPLAYHSACQATPEGYTVCEPSGAPLPPGATPPPPPVRVQADDSALVGVALRTDEAQAVPALTAVLGEPEVQEGSCLRAVLRDTLAQPLRGTELHWPGVTAYLTRLPEGRRVLTGWQLQPSREVWDRFAFALPYGVQLEDPVEQALEDIPQVRTAVPPDGRRAGVLTLTTPAVPHLEWRSYQDDDSGRVEEVAYDPEGCS